jgi:TatD DNase family protein
VIALIDCHAHLHDTDFDADRAEVIARAVAAGVQTIVTAGTDIATSQSGVELAECEPRVLATVGVHPHEAAAVRDLSPLVDLAASDQVVAIGEIGLDYHYDHSPRDIQRARFAEQLDLALRLSLPVVIHSREADEDTASILSRWSSDCRSTGFAWPFGVMHCYSYGPERLDAYLELGLAISFPGIVTYPKAVEVQMAAQAVPAEAIVVETDCPYLAPQSRRGRRNEPAMVAETAAKIAALRGTSLEELAARTTANAVRLLRLDSMRETTREWTGNRQ